jgi:carbon-monoxide dehydrogenase large subunit
VSVATGISTQGQGHFTIFAQIAAEQLGVDVKDVNVITGDTGQFHWGAGTFASRGTGVAGTAVYNAAVKIKEKAIKMAAKLLEVPEDEVELCDGKVCVVGDHSRFISLGEMAMRANPTRGVVEPGAEPGLEAVAYFGPPYGSTGAGVTAMIVDVDPESMDVKVEKFVIVHDCGVVVNPMLLEGQVVGGVHMGIGNSFYEQLKYDSNGQLLSASFMDYLVPQATDMPDEIIVAHVETPSPLNPMGVKGVGEAGAIPTPACFMQAVENALADTGLQITETPINPSRLWEMVQKASSK